MTIKAVFDGWGYVRFFGADIPNQRGEAGSIHQIDTYAMDAPATATLASRRSTAAADGHLPCLLCPCLRCHLRNRWV